MDRAAEVLPGSAAALLNESFFEIISVCSTEGHRAIPGGSSFRSLLALSRSHLFSCGGSLSWGAFLSLGMKLYYYTLTHLCKYLYTQMRANIRSASLICVGVHMVRTLTRADSRAEVGKWGETKKRVQIMLTPTATDMVDKMAQELDSTRSEVIERLIRTDCLNAEILKTIKE